MSYLVLVRHGKSEWNELGLWTGWSDVDLVPQGEQDAKDMANLIKDIKLTCAYTSSLKRAQRTCEIIKDSLNIPDIPTISHPDLNERSYGVYTGKNKWEVKKEVGDEEFQNIRRSWDHPIPEGESLKQVHDRIVPYFEKEILPKLKNGENVLISSSGNFLRALLKYLCNLTEKEVCDLEVGLGEVRIYEFNAEGKIINEELRGENPNKGKV
jgi:2,3-bisphosphoglycerate-dependent phosphoglycerate mutase